MSAAADWRVEIGCVGCGWAATELLYPAVSDFVTGENFAVRRCRNCGLAFTMPMPADLDRYYPQSYRQYSGLAMSVLHSLYVRRVHRWLSAFSRPGSALEVGCGNGWMLGVIKARGWKATGTERDAETATQAAAASGVPVVAGGLEALSAEPSFDLIILFHVLEHLPDPRATVRQCAALLRPGGRLIIGVPNLASWQSRAFGRFWFHLDVPRHLTHFSADALRVLVEQSGLSVEGMEYASFEHDPYGWVQSMLNAAGFRQNQLTRSLMGMDVSPRSVLARGGMLALAALLAVPATLLALASWLAGAGATMQLTARKEAS